MCTSQNQIQTYLGSVHIPSAVLALAQMLDGNKQYDKSHRKAHMFLKETRAVPLNMLLVFCYPLFMWIVWPKRSTRERPSTFTACTLVQL